MMLGLPISETYERFFISQMKKRHVFLQGGRRSGKTFATFVWLMFLGSLWSKTHAGDVCTIVVMCADYPQLTHTIEDFSMVTKARPAGQGINCKAYTHGGRVKWRFLAFDDNTKVQGTSCDYAFLNEAVRISEAVAKTFMSSVRSQLFYNYNPTSHWWGESYIDGENLIRTTWRDNYDNLTDAQRDEFENMKVLAMRPNASLFDTYAYKVYYLGEYAQLVGSVFHTLETCDKSVYDDIPSREQHAIDFGFSTSGDPTTMMGVKIHNNCIYVHQYIYERGLTSDIELAKRLVGCGINYRTLLLGDYGGMGRGRMDTLITADRGKWRSDPDLIDISKGFTIGDAPKEGIMDGLSQMCAMDKIIITEPSHETRKEFEGYEIGVNGKPKGDDHAIDAVRYAYTYLKLIS